MEWLNPSALLALIVVTPWKIVGWSGSAIFSIRFFLQWIASERAKKSIIPVGSGSAALLGSVLALSYFAIYRRDSVGVLMTLGSIALVHPKSLPEVARGVDGKKSKKARRGAQ